MSKQRFIVHADMDAFFAAVEQRDNPAYRGRPVIVGADPKAGRGRGVVSTASYEARKYGVDSGLPISTAYRRCPQGIFLPVDFAKYGRESEKIFHILESFTPLVERVSIDEAFLDISDTYKNYGSPHQVCLEIKERVQSRTGLTVSVGLAPNKMAAKIASGLKKPDGLVEVRGEGLLEFLRPLDAGQLWGIGPKTKAALNRLGITTLGELAARGKEELVSLFGKNGEWFWQMAQGMDDSEVTTEREVKSISNETTFAKDTSERDFIERELSWLAELVSDRLRQEGFKCKTITLKIRLENFETHTKQTTLKFSTDLSDELLRQIRLLFAGVDLRGRKVRLAGVGASQLSIAQKGELWTSKKSEVQNAVDKIRAKFGRESILRASSKPR